MTLDLAEILRRAQSPRLVSGETGKLEFIKMREQSHGGERRDKPLWECVIVFYRLTASVKSNSQINKKMMDNTLRNAIRLKHALQVEGGSANSQ